MKNCCFLLICLWLHGSVAFATETGQPVPSCGASVPATQKPLDFSAYRGQVIIVDFWATWCPPCKKSMPFLNSLRNEKQKQGFEIIAINVDEDSADAQQFLTSNPVDYQLAFDPDGDCPKIFDVKAMPSSYLVDKTGTIRMVHLGFRDGDEALLRTEVLKLLAE